jgi:hypothetical protein
VEEVESGLLSHDAAQPPTGHLKCKHQKTYIYKIPDYQGQSGIIENLSTYFMTLQSAVTSASYR